jgi:hypothetical protein
MSNEKFDFNKILKDSRETLLNPKDYFASMPLTGGFVEPIIKAAIYGTLAGLFSLLWSILGFSAMGIGAWGGALGIMSLIWSIIGAVIGVFIGGIITLVISAICGGNTDFEANVRVSASLMVVYPISALLAFFYAINFTLGGLVGVIVNLYGLYLLYEAIIKALKGKESSMKIVLIVLAVIVMLGFFQGRKATNKLRDFTEMYEEDLID